MREWGEEVHQLRAEASRLRHELSEVQASQERSAASLKKSQAVEKAQSVEKTANLLGKGEGKFDGMIPFESAPPVVGAAIVREMGGGQLRVLHSSAEDGKAIYNVKGQLADGRAIGMRLAEDGSVLEKSTEIPAETLPVQVQNPVAKTFGDINISSARQIIDKGNVSYELGAKGPNMGMQITVRDDGTILAYPPSSGRRSRRGSRGFVSGGRARRSARAGRQTEYRD